MNDRYRICVDIIRGTCAGRALALMANGLIVSAANSERADELYDQYLDAAEPILATANAGTTFGLIAILDTQGGVVCRHQALVGKAAVVRRAAGEPAELKTEPAGSQWSDRYMGPN